MMLWYAIINPINIINLLLYALLRVKNYLDQYAGSCVETKDTASHIY